MIDTRAFSTSERRRFQSSSHTMTSVLSLASAAAAFASCLFRTFESDTSCQ